MTGRHVRVGIAEAPNPAADVNLARVNIRERIMRWLFGPMNELTVIVPGRRVHDVTLSRRSAKPAVDEAALNASIERHPAGSKLTHDNGGDAA
ncbi:hypothetical protein [Schaalia sp. lx-100]|uniref:hypothetical protein n=1 Tax=Schaalia sp. lx-100 TaxID=2899081 RepID=UPI001E3BD80C|nr:hypothetical protein [Schaalia sp. lx-100]MCD4557005.1 hypothetical protein [Schaalia sp. lx-100]